MKIITKILASLAIVGIMTPGLVNTVSAYKCPDGSIRGTGTDVSNPSLCNVKEDAAGASNLFGTIQTAVNVVLSVLGIVTVLMIVLGGVNYTTSQGDPGKTKKAKDTIVFGIIGLIIAMLAFAIVNFVLTSVFQ